MNGQEGKAIAFFMNQEFEFFDGEITDGKAHIGDGIKRRGMVILYEVEEGVIFPFGVPAGEAEGKIALWAPFLEVERALFKAGIIKTDPAQFLLPGLKGEEA